MSTTKYCEEGKVWRGPPASGWPCNEKTNLGRILLSFMNRDPNRVAQISDNSGIRMTNREIISDAERIAGGLKARGCKTGDVVGFVARNGHNVIPTLVACFLLEAPTNTMDIIPNEDELYAMFSITKPKFIFCDDDRVPQVQNVITRLQSSTTVIVFGGKVPNYIHIEDFMKEGDREDLRREIYEESSQDIKMNYQLIVGSSGTTGPRKAVAIPYLPLLDPNPPSRLSSTSSATHFSFCSISWTSFYNILFRCIFYGLTLIITTEGFTPELNIHILKKYKVNYTSIPIIFLNQIIESPTITPTSFQSLNEIYCAGSLVTEDALNKLLPYLPQTDFQIIYGMSEIGGISAYIYDRKKSVSVGNLLPNVQGIVINEEGHRLGPGETGQLCFKKPLHMIEYMGNAEATKNFFSSEGFAYTGDLGYYDTEGFLYITGRCKDVIKYFLWHVSASEIERIVKSLPGVENAVAVGIEDSQVNQLPAVAVTTKKGSTQVTAEEISSLVASKLPDSHKLRGGVYFLEKLPVTLSGKIKKYEIKRSVEEMFNSKS